MSSRGVPLLAITKSKTLVDNSLKNKDLSQKMILSVEAQRISNVLKNCMSQIEIAAALPSILCSSSASGVIDKELMRELRKHQLLDEKFESETLESLKQESEREDGEAGRRARERLERDIKNSVRDLLRLFHSNPDAIYGLRADQGMDVGENECKLIRGLKMFSHVVDKLLTSLYDEQQLVIPKLSSSSATDLEPMAPMEEEVAIAKKQIDAKIFQKNIEIKNLQNSLQANNTQEAVLLLLADKKGKAHINISEKQASIQQDIDQLKIKLNNLILENRKTERVIQEKNEQVEAEIQCLLQTFDGEIDERQANLELNENDYEIEEEELRRLETSFCVLEMEYNQIQERHKLTEEQKEKEMRELDLKTRAAILAQAWWRGYCIRKALKSQGKKKKGKKGKGKKKK